MDCIWSRDELLSHSESFASRHAGIRARKGGAAA
jgi:hypothetical protein